MSNVLISGAQVADWQKLVSEAEAELGVSLDEELESYLVFLLMRFHNQPEIAGSVMALEYLDGLQQTGRIRQEQMRSVGDQCLLYSGLFPQYARKRRVTVSYYVDLGRSAYRNLAEDEQFNLSTMFAKLAIHFIALMDTLQALRSLSMDRPLLDPLTATELWQSTGSCHARSLLKCATEGEVVIQTPINQARKH